jgi:hypothetical protein
VWAAKSSRTEAGSGAAPAIGSRSVLMSASTGTWARVPGVEGLVAVAGRARPHHPDAAEHRGDAGDDQGVDVEQRQPAQHPLPGGQPAAHGDAAGAGELVGVGVRGDFRGAGGPPGMHERGQIIRPRPTGAGQVAGRLPGDHLLQVGHDRAAAI